MVQDTKPGSAQVWLKPISSVFFLFCLIIVPWLYARFVLKGPLGCKRLGRMKQETELADQYDSKYSCPPTTSSIALNKSIGTVKALHIFPIKSCRGIENSKIHITRTGPRYDRQFAFAQYHTHTVGNEKVTGWNKITQREFPKMALIEPEIWVPEPSASDELVDEEVAKNGGYLVVTFPRRISLSPVGLFNGLASLVCKLIERNWLSRARHKFYLPLEPSPKRINELRCPIARVQIWADNASGVDMRNLVPLELMNELKAFLGVKNDFAIFRTNPENFREIFRNAPRPDKLGYQATTGFADSYPLHFLNLASVHNIATYLPPSFGRLDARRFRSNVLGKISGPGETARHFTDRTVVTGPPAHSEDDWSVATIGPLAYKIYLTDHTTRCQLPNVDPARGTVAPYKLPWHAEPIKTLLGKDRSRNPAFMEPLKAMRDPARANRCIDKGAADKACLGMQAVPSVPIADANDKEEEVWLHIGDEVVVLETGEHIFTPK